MKFTACQGIRIAQRFKSALTKGVNVQWFYVSDPAISKSKTGISNVSFDKFAPKKWTTFSKKDSQLLEERWQLLQKNESSKIRNEDLKKKLNKLTNHCETPLHIFNDALKTEKDLKPLETVVVSEYNLFEANVNLLTLSPIYSDGPVYVIRRGLWFDEDNHPLDNKTTEELEKGYIEHWINVESDGKSKPFEKRTTNIKGGTKGVVYVDQQTAYLVDDPFSLNNSKLYLLEKLPQGANFLPGFTKITRGYIETGEKEGSDNDKSSSVNTDIINLLTLNTTETKTSKMIDDQMSSDQESFKSKRKVDHLVFCIHGIGQILGSEYENVNFIHTVNNLRQNLWKNSSEFLGEEDCRIEVIPIIWRNLIDFNNDSKIPDEEKFPTLRDITIKEIEPVRYLLNNTLLDILLYYEDPYKTQILFTVIKEVNTAFRRFLIYNPDFKGKISIIGHSLGSAIGLDILANQKFDLAFKNTGSNEELNRKLENTSPLLKSFSSEHCQLDFPVENFFMVGSPFGLFNLLKRKSIKSRKIVPHYNKDMVEKLDLQKVSFPKCCNLFNIFDPSDPIAYRIEPLIGHSYATMKPKEITYKPLLKNSHGLIDSIIESDIVNTGKTYLSGYTNTGLKLLNERFEAMLDTSASFFNEERKHIKTISDDKHSIDQNENKSDALADSDMIIEDEKDISVYLIYNALNHNLKSEKYIKDRLEILACNSSGRVDYSIPQNVYDIPIINVLKSHVSYFENEHISRFLTNFLLIESENNKS